MRYMLLIYGDEAKWMALSPEEQDAVRSEYVDYSRWLGEKGWIRDGDELADSPTATVVRRRNGEVLATDGPFTETREQLGGYFEIECEDLDQAIEAAGRCPAARHGAVEIRPIIDSPQPQPG